MDLVILLVLFLHLSKSKESLKAKNVQNLSAKEFVCFTRSAVPPCGKVVVPPEMIIVFSNMTAQAEYLGSMLHTH
jgi:hypothetical protein